VKLIAAGLVKEVKAKAGMPIWRRDAQNAKSFALKLTAVGAKAIAVTTDDDATPAATEERLSTEQSTTLAAPAQNAAGVFAVPSIQTLAMPRAPRAGTKLAQVIEMLRAAEGATIAELAEAMGWLAHTTRAVLTGLRKRDYALTLDRSDARRGSAYRIAIDGNDGHAATAPTVTESSAALIDEASDPPVSSARPASPAALRRCRSSGTSRAA
jgi:hypothetical protein